MERERIRLIEPSKNFISTIAEFIKEIGDPVTTLVIFPNIRPSYYLKEKLATDSSNGLALPQIYSIDEFTKKVVLNLTKDESLKFADFYDAFMLFSRSFKDDLSALCSKEDITNDDILTLSTILWSEFEELKINKIEPQKVREYDFLISEEAARRVTENIKDRVGERFGRYSELYSKFYNELSQKRLFTRAMIYYEASEKFDRTFFKDIETIIVAGFFITTKSETDLFKKIYEEFDDSYFFFQDHEIFHTDMGKDRNLYLYFQLQEGSQEKISSFTKEEAKFPQIKATPSRHAEIFALKKDITKILQKNENGKPPSTAIILPDSQTIWPLIEYLLGDISEFNITAPCSLDHTPWLSLFEIIKDITTNAVRTQQEVRFPVKKVLSFYSHPYIKAILKDKRKEEDLGFKFFITADEIGELFFKEKNEGEKFVSSFIKGFEKIADVDDFLKRIEEIVKIIVEDAGKAEFVETGKLILQEIAKIRNKGIKGLRFERVETYFDLLKRILNNISFPFKGEPVKGLQCMGVLEGRLLNFDDLFILDLNSGVIPPEKKDLFLLSDMIRKKLRLGTNNERFDLYYYYLSTLIRGARNTTIYFVENKRMMKSPILEKIIWEKEKELNRILDSQITTYPKLEFLSVKRRKIVEKTKEIKEFLKGFTFSPSALDTYIECPVKFYYSYVLGIPKKESEDIDQGKIGIFLHSILKNTFESYKGKSFSQINENGFTKKFEDNMDKVSKDMGFDKHHPKPYFIISQAKPKGEEILKRMQKSFGGYKIIGAEVEGEVEITKEFQDKEKQENRKIKLQGKPDLIIESENEILIIDFKTSSNPKDHLPKFSYFDPSSRASSPGSVQMPFYVMVFEKIINSQKEKKKNINGCVFSLGRKDCSFELLYSDEKKREKHQKIEDFILSKITEIIESVYFTPPENPPCEECPYNQICIDMEEGKDFYFKKEKEEEGEVSFITTKYIPFKEKSNDPYDPIRKEIKDILNNKIYDDESGSQKLYARFEGDCGNSDIDNILLYNIGINGEFSSLILEADKREARYFYSNKIENFKLYNQLPDPVFEFSYSLPKNGNDYSVAKIWYKARSSFTNPDSNSIKNEFNFNSSILHYDIIMKAEIIGVESLHYSNADNKTLTIKSLIDATLTAICYNKEEKINENPISELINKLQAELSNIPNKEEHIRDLLSKEVGIPYHQPLFVKYNSLQSNPPDDHLKAVKITCKNSEESKDNDEKSNDIEVRVSIYLLTYLLPPIQNSQKDTKVKVRKIGK